MLVFPFGRCHWIVGLMIMTKAASSEISLGNLRTLEHEVAGEVVLLSERVFEIRNFVYDGDGPAAYFWADTNSRPSPQGYILQDASPTFTCGQGPIPRASRGETFRVEFPVGTSVRDILGGSISVWCEAFTANFGDVQVPSTLNGLLSAELGPALECSTTNSSEISLGDLRTLEHEVAGEVVLLSERLFEIRNFVYDGDGPAAYFWADTNPDPSSQGYILQDASPTLTCGRGPIPRASRGETFRVEFPEGTSVRDILGGSISVWCEAFNANFGEVKVPSTLNGLLTTVYGPKLECSTNGLESVPGIARTPSGYNCESLHEDLQVRWKVNSNNMLAVELVGRLADSFTYMAFGLSGSSTSTNMIGADAVVADFATGLPRVRDLFMSSRAQCSNGRGVCPDSTMTGLTDDVSSVSGEQGFGLTVIRYQRPLVPSDVGRTVDGVLADLPISVASGDVSYLVWAMGPVSTDTSYPNFHLVYPRENVSLEFGRGVVDNCTPLAVLNQPTNAPTASVVPYFRPMIRDVETLVARIGPNGGRRGYSAITGRTAWGIAWYINDILIPVIQMRRGTTYTFVVSGGNNPDEPSQYHPFYLTTSISGGYVQLSPAERLNETVLAGINITNQSSAGIFDYVAEAVAPLCVYRKTAASDNSSLTETFSDFLSTLDRSCGENVTITQSAYRLTFTPDSSTPDLIYYQCVTHRNLGWQIQVLDADVPMTSSPIVLPSPSPSGSLLRTSAPESFPSGSVSPLQSPVLSTLAPLPFPPTPAPSMGVPPTLIPSRPTLAPTPPTSPSVMIGNTSVSCLASDCQTLRFSNGTTYEFCSQGLQCTAESTVPATGKVLVVSYGCRYVNPADVLAGKVSYDLSRQPCSCAAVYGAQACNCRACFGATHENVLRNEIPFIVTCNNFVTLGSCDGINSALSEASGMDSGSTLTATSSTQSNVQDEEGTMNSNGLGAAELARPSGAFGRWWKTPCIFFLWLSVVALVA